MTLKRVIPHGRILSRPTRRPRGTKHSVGYELGKCFQLDRDHVLLVASMDEQGGGDLCVGNDGFIFRNLGEIDPTRAIPLNWPDEDYPLKHSPGRAFLAKYPLTGTFVSLGARLSDGRTHPAAGTGILVGEGVTFNADRSSAGSGSEIVMEFLQLRWNGHSLEVTEKNRTDQALGFRLCGTSLSYFLLCGEHILAPFVTDRGIVVFQFSFDGRRWQITGHGDPFVTHHRPDWIFPTGEMEPSILRTGDGFLVYTRGADPKGRVYRSDDGLNFRLWFERDNHTVPQALNQASDGTVYLTTNTGPGMLRNPLLGYSLEGDRFGEPFVIHDEDGIRDDRGEKVPFVDHGVGVNLVLENRPRHFLWYRVCDLRERTFHGHQAGLQTEFHKSGGPATRSESGGLYLAELEFK